MQNKGSGDQGVHRFGGDWTTAKLEVIAKYLHAYTTAMKNQPFSKWYIDAFAGTGYRQPSRQGETGDTHEARLVPAADPDGPQKLLDGSARIALKTNPPFDHFVFIEQSEKRCAELRALRAEFQLTASRVQIHQGEANEALEGIHEGDWSGKRAVLFLDPYGTQVEWKTIQAIASTQAIDLWVLFPLMGVSRMLTKSGEIPEPWRRRLTALFGTDAWYKAVYDIKAEATLFGDEQRVMKADVEVIGQLFNDRLREIFPGVARHPGVLRNSTNTPLFLLCFAASNPRGAKIALKIAEHLLKELR